MIRNYVQYKYILNVKISLEISPFMLRYEREVSTILNANWYEIGRTSPEKAGV